MKPENDLTVFGMRIVAVRVPRTGALHVRIECERPNSGSIVIGRWECPSGRPTPAQCDEMAATLGGEFVSTMVVATGIQGVLPA